MANLATINNNLLADSGIDPLSLVVGTGVANQIAYWTDDSTIAALSTTTYPSLTELSYVKGVTSAIQTQIDAKLSLSGGTMTGNINWAQTDRGIVWAFNTDGAYIKFYNTGDGDANSRLEFATIDNNDEYFRWGHVPSGGSFYESMKLVPISSGNAELTVSGKIIKAGGTSSQFLKANGDVDSTSYQPSLTLTTTGTSGAATLVGATLNIPQYQSALTNPVTGTGTANYIPKFTGTSSIGNGLMYDDGTNIAIGVTSTITKLSIGSYTGARLPYIDGTTRTFNANGITVTSSNNANAAVGGGLDLTNNTYSVGAYSPILSFSSLSSNGSFNNSYAGIWGVLGGQGVDANWVVGSLVFGTSIGAGIREAMRIDSSGRLGVNTTSMDSRIVSSYGTLTTFDNTNITTTTALLLTASDPGTTSSSHAVSLAFRPIINRGAAATLTVFNDSVNKEGGTIITFNSGGGAYPSSLTERFRIWSDGKVRFNQYGTGLFTGTVAYNLAVNSNGDIIETAGGVVDGSGTANYVSRWQDANTLTNSIIYDSGTNIGINTATPGQRLSVVGNSLLIGTISQNASLQTGNTWANLILDSAASSNSDTNLVYARAGTMMWDIYNDATNDSLNINTKKAAGAGITTTFLQDGSVGIGTVTPLTRLHVNDSVNVSNLTMLTLSQLGNTGNRDVVNLKLSFNNGNTPGIMMSAIKNASAGSDLTLSTGANSNGALGERLRILSSGFVGINESAPGYRLQVTDSNQYVAGFINNVADQLLTVTVQNSAQSTAGVKTAAATFELVGKAGTSPHGRHSWIGSEGVASATFRTKLLFKIRGESNTGYTWSGVSEAPTIVTMDGNGQVSFNQYTSSSSFTGTAAGILAFDSGGNIITQSATLYPSGSGTTNYVTKWTGANTVGDSQIFDNGSGVGIGTATITGKLNVSNGNAHLNNYFVTGTSAGWDIKTYFTGGNAGSEQFIYFGYPTAETNVYIQRGSNGRLEFGTAATSRMIIDASGRLGIKTTPSAWGSAYGVIDLNTGGSVYGTSNGVSLSANLYFDGTDWRTKTTDAGNLLASYAGNWFFYNCPSASAGSAASLSEVLRISSGGNIISQGYNIILGSNNNSTFSSTASYTLYIANAGAEGATAQGQIAFGEVNNYGINTTRIGAAITTYFAASYGRLGLVFKTKNTSNDAGPTEKMRLTDDGYLLLNTTSSNGNTLRVNGSGYFDASITAISATANNGSPYAGLFWSGDDSSAMWRGAIAVQHNPSVTIVAGSSIGIVFTPLASTGSSFYGHAAIKAVRPNATANNQDTDLVFWTRTGASNSTVDSEKMRLIASGNFGIGNSNPYTKLHVNNAISGAILPYIGGTGLSYNNEGISVAGSNTNNTNIGNGLTLYNNVSSVGAYGPVVAWSSRSASGAYNSTYAFITGVYRGNGGDFNWAAGDIIFGTAQTYGATEKMRIKDSGYIGMGTDAPTGLLHLYGSNPAFRIQNSGTGNMQFGQWDGSTNRIQSSGRDFLLISTDATSLVFSTNSAERVRIYPAGQVLIQDPSGGFSNSEYSSLTIANNSADGVVDFTKGISFVDNVNGMGSWTHAGIVATGSSGYNGNLVFGTDGSGTQAKVITERMRIRDDGVIRITSGGTTNAATLELSSSATPSTGATISVSYLGTGSYGPLLFSTGGSEKMRLTSGGLLGINTTPTTVLHVYDSTQDRFNIRISSTIANNANKYMGIGFSGEEANTKGAIFFQSYGSSYSRGKMIFALNNAQDQSNATPSNAILTLEAGGNATFVSYVTATAYYESSDSRIKTLLDNTIDYSIISNVEARYYEKNGVQELGYFAQDFENILSSAVYKDDKGFLNLSYTQVHTAKIAALEARVKELESQLKNK